MRVKTWLFLATWVFVAVAAVKVPAYPSRIPSDWVAPRAANQSLSGKIVAIGDAEFSVRVGKNKDATPVKFLIDENTQFEGRLSLGARAVVEYHTEGTSNIAVHIVVMTASGITTQ